MPYIKPEIIAEARKMDLLTYLKNYEPYELVRVSRNEYSTKSHDSLRISNGKWMWWSRGIGGHSALDYLIEVRGERLTDAVQIIMGRVAIEPPVPIIQPANKKRQLTLPEKNPESNVIMKYLSDRGISKEVIQHCINSGRIYESRDYHNVVFVGNDEHGKVRYAAYRACSDRRIMGDAEGSDKRFSFRFGNETNDELHLFEGAIDLLSYATIMKMTAQELESSNLISLAGVYVPTKNPEQMKMPLALENFVKNPKQIRTVYLHLDNDATGRLASKMITKQLENIVKVIDDPPPKGKDMNKFLQMTIESRDKEVKER